MNHCKKKKTFFYGYLYCTIPIEHSDSALLKFHIITNVYFTIELKFTRYLPVAKKYGANKTV